MTTTESENPASKHAGQKIRRRLAGALRRLEHALAGADPIVPDLHLVLTIPKTGTHTLLNFLGALDIRGEVRSAYHQLGPDLSPDVWKPLPTDEAARSLLAHAAWERGRVTERWMVHRRFRNSASGNFVPPRKASVLVATREPVGQRLSNAFYVQAAISEENRISGARAQLEDRSPVERGILRGRRWWELDGWFDVNIKTNFGIDVFAEPFDIARGWKVYEGDDARLLLIRQESFARLPEAMQAFYSLSAVPSTGAAQANAGLDREYSAVYSEAKKRIRLSSALLDEVYSARYARHFYSGSEIAEFKHRWGEQR